MRCACVACVRASASVCSSHYAAKQGWYEHINGPLHIKMGKDISGFHKLLSLSLSRSFPRSLNICPCACVCVCGCNHLKIGSVRCLLFFACIADDKEA